jgi:hypothetical protein
MLDRSVPIKFSMPMGNTIREFFGVGAAVIVIAIPI